MAYFFFIDESGIDRRNSPYEVLCGVAIEDRDLWNIVSQLKNLEDQLLGTRYSGQKREIKGSKFLKKKVFKQAASFDSIHIDERTLLAKQCMRMVRLQIEGKWQHYHNLNLITSKNCWKSVHSFV